MLRNITEDAVNIKSAAMLADIESTKDIKVITYFSSMNQDKLHSMKINDKLKLQEGWCYLNAITNNEANSIFRYYNYAFTVDLKENPTLKENSNTRIILSNQGSKVEEWMKFRFLINVVHNIDLKLIKKETP